MKAILHLHHVLPTSPGQSSFLCKFSPQGSKYLGPTNHIKGKKVLKIRALPKVAEPWMGNRNYPSIISQQGANSIVDETLNPWQTHPSHFSQSPPSFTTASFLCRLNLQGFLNVHHLSLMVHCNICQQRICLIL